MAAAATIAAAVAVLSAGGACENARRWRQGCCQWQLHRIKHHRQEQQQQQQNVASGSSGGLQFRAGAAAAAIFFGATGSGVGSA
jgi:hypothetical protein